MKRFKFRVWDTIKHKMYTPMAVSFDIQSSVPFAVSVPGRSWEPSGKYELLQWTGLSDAQGTDIYEGDYITLSSQVFKVGWNETAASFELENLENFTKSAITEALSGIVTGNQFETNPD